MAIQDQEIDSTRVTQRGQGRVLTEDEEGAGDENGGEVDEGGAEVESPSRGEEAVCGGMVDAGAEEVGEEHRREEQVEEHDEERERDLAVEGNEIAVGVGG